MRVLAGSAAVLVTLALTGVAEAQTVPSVTVPSVGGTPPVSTPEIQLPLPQSGGTPQNPGDGSGGGTGGGGGGGQTSQPSSPSGTGSTSKGSGGGGNSAPKSQVAGDSASSGGGSTSSTGSAGSSAGSAGSQQRTSSGASKKKSGGADKSTRVPAAPGPDIKAPATLAAEAADSGEDGPAIVLWIVGLLMLASGTIVLLRRRVRALQTAGRDPGPAPWAGWEDRFSRG